jgi:hypothetical protein
MTEIVCTGLRASNPISVMAAFGLLRICHERLPDLGPCHLFWQWREPEWFAVLGTGQSISSDQLLDALASLDFGHRQEFEWRDEVKKLTREGFRERAGGSDRCSLDWLAALAAENIVEGKEKSSTPFDTTAGQWKLLVKFRAIHTALFPTPAQPQNTRARFQEAILGDWQYADREICFNWDPDLVPEGAYSPGNPAKTKIISVLALTWLAIESLPLFPCDGTRRRLRTRAFVVGGRPELRWPVWTAPLSLPALKSLLGMPELVVSNPPLAELRRRGIVAVFRSRRWNPTKYGAFTQATLCLPGRR